MLCCGAQRTWAQTPTTTTLAIASSGAAVSTVPWGSVVTLTAIVKAGSTAVTAGQVNFCDAAATYCTDIHLVGIGQLTSAGAAVFQYVPAPGSHSYKAEFVGTAGDAASSSSVADLSVTATAGQAYPTSTTIAQSGNPGNYTLTATVTGFGGTVAPTGTVSFLDTSNAGAVLGTSALGTGTTGALNWTNPQTPLVGGSAQSDPQSVVVGDFNGDGIPDIAVGATNKFVSVLLGKGDGTFKPANNLPTNGNNQSMAAAAFVTGGPAGILTVSNSAAAINNAQLILGNGSGGETVGTPFSLPCGSASAVATGDFNGDGNQDFMVVCQESGIPVFAVFFGNGNGTFGVPTIYPSDGTILAIGVGNFFGNGRADIAVMTAVTGSSYIHTVTTFENDGHGNFSAGVSIAETGMNPTSMVVADFNGDGDADLAVANSGDNTVTILTGAGNGAFHQLASPSTGSSPSSIAVGDFNGDGIPDLAVANSGDKTVTVLLGNGDGTFTVASTSPATGSAPSSIAVADFNGVGTAGLAVANAGDGTVTVQVSQLTQTATASAIGISPGGSGVHLVDASYPGDANYAASVSGTTNLNAQTASTTLTLTANPTSSTNGQQVLLTATLNPYSAGGNTTNGETVTFYSGISNLGTGTLTSGVATLNTTSLPTGSDSLTAKFSGDTNFNASTSLAVTFAVAPAATAATPAFSVATGTYTTTQTVTISDATAGATIYYTTNGTAPTTSSTVYSGPITVSSTETLEAIATASGYSTSAVASATYTITPPAATPTFNVPAGTYTATQTVTISDATVGATIYYTANGTTPTAGSTVYTGPITVSSTETLEAIATATGYSTSAAATAAYIITIPPVVSATVSPASLTFAAQATGSTSAAQTVTLTNTGTGALAISSIAASANFAETNTCGSSLAAGGNCTISVTFTPTAAGSLPGTITITDNASSSPQTVTLAGTGTSVGVAPTSSSLTIPSPGGSATDTIQISSAGGFSGTVILTCMVAYQGSGTATDMPTCNLNPQQGQVSAGSPLTTTLTVSTTGTGSSAKSNGAWLPSGAAVAALFFFGFLPRRRWKSTALLVLLGITIGCAAIGCGGTPQTTKGNYQVVVTASSATVTASTTIPLALQ
jgi:hypothetical protein